MSDRQININQEKASIGIAYGENVKAEEIAGTMHNYAQEQNLTKAAAEIQQLLKQLEQTYPTETLSQKAVIAEEAIKRIENNPTLKGRVMGAIQAMGIEAFMQAIDHPVANVLRAGVEAFKEPHA